MRSLTRMILWLAVLLPMAVSAQIDPVKRDLIQFGYNQPLAGAEPLAAYAYYYRNDPNFIRTNLTLRLAVAPVYLDSELGFVHGLGPQTDFGIGLAGGAFADSYNEIDGGKWIKEQSFDGDGAEVSGSIYHLFNPNDLIPLNFVLRGTAHYSVYEANEDTANDPHVPNNARVFAAPSDSGIFSLRTGLRYGGIEPTLFPSLAMELSAWYQGSYRTAYGNYGFDGDHSLEPDTHLFWGAAALAYTLDKSKQTFFVQAIAGTSINADRMTAYRLGGFLPLSAEYPLSIPGFYYQELSAREFALVNASYMLPIAPNQRWNLYINAATADVNYVSGTESYETPISTDSPKDPNWVSGVGGGILYRSPHDRYKFIITYAYGIDAVRSDGRGGSSIGFLMQINLEKSHNSRFDSGGPGQYNGWNWLLGR